MKTIKITQQVRKIGEIDMIRNGKIFNMYTVGGLIIFMSCIQIILIQKFKVLNMVHSDVSSLEATIDYVALCAFPVLLIVLGMIALWVTKLKTVIQAQKDQVQEDRDDMANVFNNMESIVKVVDIETHKILYINKAFVNLINETLDKHKTYKDLINKLCYKEINNTNTICSHCALATVLDYDDSSYVWEFDYKSLGKWFRLTEKIITWKDRKCKLTIGYDITEDKKKFAEHKLSEHRLSCMIECLTDACCLFEPDDKNVCKSTVTAGWVRVLYNKKYEELFAEYGHDISTDPYSCVFPKRTREKLLRLFDEAFTTGQHKTMVATFKKRKLSFYIYKANHGVMVGIRQKKS